MTNEKSILIEYLISAFLRNLVQMTGDASHRLHDFERLSPLRRGAQGVLRLTKGTLVTATGLSARGSWLCREYQDARKIGDFIADEILGREAGNFKRFVMNFGKGCPKILPLHRRKKQKVSTQYPKAVSL